MRLARHPCTFLAQWKKHPQSTRRSVMEFGSSRRTSGLGRHQSCHLRRLEPIASSSGKKYFPESIPKGLLRSGEKHSRHVLGGRRWLQNSKLSKATYSSNSRSRSGARMLGSTTSSNAIAVATNPGKSFASPTGFRHATVDHGCLTPMRRHAAMLGVKSYANGGRSSGTGSI